MKIYTKTGDDGSTSLFNGERRKKNSLRTSAYGDADELNSVLGLALASHLPVNIEKDIQYITRKIFALCSDLATPMESNISVPRIESKHIEELEIFIDSYQEQLPELHRFIMPGGSIQGSYLFNARTIARRAERSVITLSESELINEWDIKFLNRLSDYLFVASRLTNFLLGIEESLWDGK